MRANSDATQWVVGSIAFLGLLGSVVQFVWSGSRTDVIQLEGRLDRAINQISREITDLKTTNKDHVTLVAHQDLKEQFILRNTLVDKTIDRNTNSISELLVKKDVFDRYLVDQAERDRITSQNVTREIDMLRAAIQMVRVELNSLRDKQMPTK